MTPPGRRWTFDTPLFNQLLTALDNMAADNLDRPAVMSDMEYDEFYQLYSGLFWRIACSAPSAQAGSISWGRWP